jgi:hypothetical protein
MSKLEHLANARQFNLRLFTPLGEKLWVVHVEPAPSGCQDPESVLKYLIVACSPTQSERPRRAIKRV